MRKEGRGCPSQRGLLCANPRLSPLSAPFTGRPLKEPLPSKGFSDWKHRGAELALNPNPRLLEWKLIEDAVGLPKSQSRQLPEADRLGFTAGALHCHSLRLLVHGGACLAVSPRACKWRTAMWFQVSFQAKPSYKHKSCRPLDGNQAPTFDQLASSKKDARPCYLHRIDHKP